MTVRNQPRHTGPSLCAILIALVASLGITQAAHAGTITIEWDRSPDPTVIGYRVSVGTSPGIYTETFDVGSATSFIYQAPDNRVYFLAVAAYAEGPLVGPLSDAVSGTPTPDARSFYQSLWRDIAAPSAIGRLGTASPARILGRSAATAASASSPSKVCWTGISGCLSIRNVIRRSAEITSIAVGADNRLFFIEGGQRIGVVVSGVLQARPVLVPDRATVHFEQVSLDPAFAVTSLAYVSETETYADGQREFRVVQYRVFQNRAVDRTLVTAIRLPLSGRATFALTSGGQVYVTVPTDDSSGRTAGRVLRLNTDGTLPPEQDGSAIIGEGYASPGAAAFDEYTPRLWIAGVDGTNHASVATMDGPLTPIVAPVTSLSTATDSMGRTSLFASSALGTLTTGRAQPDGSVTDTGELRIPGGFLRTVTATPSGELFVAVADGSFPTTSFSIWRLTPLR